MLFVYYIHAVDDTFLEMYFLMIHFNEISLILVILHGPLRW